MTNAAKKSPRAIRPLSVGCPKCGAKAGDACADVVVTPFEGFVFVHYERMDAALHLRLVRAGGSKG